MKTLSLLSAAVAASLAIAFTTPAFAAALSSVICSGLLVLTLSDEYSPKARSRFARLYASGALTGANPLRLAA